MVDSLLSSELACCALCGGALDWNDGPIYCDSAVSCHLTCLRGTWNVEKHVWDGSGLEAALAITDGASADTELAEVTRLLMTGGDSNPGIQAEVVELVGWPGRGQDDGPMGWPGVEGMRPPTFIHVLPESFLHIRGLRKLEVSHHPISELPQHGWRELTGLKRLSFCSCRLRQLPEEVAEILSLEVLAVMQNVLHRLPSAIGSMQRLRMLLATANCLSGLPEPFGPPSLKTLTVEGNAVPSVPVDLLVRCPMLTELRLTGNNLVGGFHESVDSAANALTSTICGLAIAYWQGCQLKRLPDSMIQPCIGSLQYLLLSDNCLESPLPAAVASLRQLRWLYLYGNRLRELPEGLLIGCKSMVTCLLEGNPLIASALDGLLCDARTRAEKADGPDRFRVLGLDAMQVRHWRGSMQRSLATEQRNYDDSSPELQPLPACVQSGWLVAPAGRWYGKLMPSSQLNRADGAPTLGDCDGDEKPPLNRKDRVLMVALAASQSEPEWGGELGKLQGQRRHTLALQEYGRRPTLQEHAAVVRTLLPHLPFDNMHLMSTLWADFNEVPMAVSDEAGAEEELGDDFDVLLLVDPCRRWYNDGSSGTAPLNRGSFREDFISMTTGYGRVCALGASMGGFAALSCADLVDSVLAFGPQIDLESAPYRPGYETEALKQASQGLRDAVACRRGSVECHMSMDAHLFQATRLHPLPASSLAEAATESSKKQRTSSHNRAHHLRLIVHPFKGRTARVLEKAGLLLPLLAATLARLQHEVQNEHSSSKVSSAGAQMAVVQDEWPSWQWPFGDEDDDHGSMTPLTLLVGCWRNWARSPGGSTWLPAALRILRTTPLELRALSQHAPYPGEWFCATCGCRNKERQPRCTTCGTAVLEQVEHAIVTVPGGDGPAFRHGDWECTWCRRLEYRRELACGQCGRARDVAIESVGGVVCANAKCCTSAAVLIREGPLLAHPSDGLAYCKGCCRLWEHMMAHPVACTA